MKASNKWSIIGQTLIEDNIPIKIVNLLFFFFFGDAAMLCNVFASSLALFLQDLTSDVVLCLPFLNS